MSRSSRKKQKRQRHQHQHATATRALPYSVKAKTPEQKLPGMFRVLDDVIRTAIEQVAATPDDKMSDEKHFDTAALMRGVNILEASRMLLAVGHWEAASGLARQLFELLVNMEEVARRDDSSAARLRYARYGLLQETRRRVREIADARNSGQSVNEDFAAELDALLAGPAFEEFRRPSGAWEKSWSRKPTEQLARASGGLRERQYEVLFRSWSEETHATPSTLTRSMMTSRTETWVEELQQRDEREVAQLLLMLVALFLELEDILSEGPKLSWERKSDWMDALGTEVQKRGQLPPATGLPRE